jgi:peptidoglycan/xylan/chitin deacetylase (PgdA/CDA1 family)
MKHNPLLIATMIALLMFTQFIDARFGDDSSPPPARREVAVTFDDLPAQSCGDVALCREMTTKLLRAITSNKVPVIGFVNENKLLTRGELDDRRVALLRMWLDAGLELGNHSFSHPDLHTTLLDAFQEDVVRGEAVTRKLMEAKGKKLRYFRQPFLHTGRDLETKRRLEAFLAARGYRVAPVTIDNSEWIFARAYDKAAENGDQQMMKRVGEAYIPYMERRFEYFEKQSAALFGREIKQVLLVHANALNADYFGQLARMITRRGYTFLSLDQALEDTAYESLDTYTGSGGITWFHRWAISLGIKEKIVPDEPRTPDFVMKLAGVTGE